MKRFFSIALLLAAGCARVAVPPVRVNVSRELVQTRLHRLAVLPASVAPDAGPVPSGAADTVTEVVLHAVAREARWTVTDPESVSAALRSVSEGERTDVRAAVVATKVGSEAALATTVRRYRDRMGGAYGASEPASVAIEMILVSAKDRTVLWNADYAFTQEPLAYNLWNFWTVLRGGPRWLTAAELTRIGVEEAVERLRAAAGAALR